MLNQVYVLGKLISKSEMVYNGNIPQIFLLIATEHEGKTTFVDVLVAGKHAENCKANLKVSSKVLIEGRLYTCEKTFMLKVLAYRIQILDSDEIEYA